jgi:hypothetical protein
VGDDEHSRARLVHESIQPHHERAHAGSVISGLTALRQEEVQRIEDDQRGLDRRRFARQVTQHRRRVSRAGRVHHVKLVSRAPDSETVEPLKGERQRIVQERGHHRTGSRREVPEQRLSPEHRASDLKGKERFAALVLAREDVEHSIRDEPTDEPRNRRGREVACADEQGLVHPVADAAVGALTGGLGVWGGSVGRIIPSCTRRDPHKFVGVERWLTVMAVDALDVLADHLRTETKAPRTTRETKKPIISFTFVEYQRHAGTSLHIPPRRSRDQREQPRRHDRRRHVVDVRRHLPFVVRPHAWLLGGATTYPPSPRTSSPGAIRTRFGTGTPGCVK